MPDSAEWSFARKRRTKGLHPHLSHCREISRRDRDRMRPGGEILLDEMCRNRRRVEDHVVEWRHLDVVAHNLEVPESIKSFRLARLGHEIQHEHLQCLAVLQGLAYLRYEKRRKNTGVEASWTNQDDVGSSQCLDGSVDRPGRGGPKRQPPDRRARPRDRRFADDG